MKINYKLQPYEFVSAYDVLDKLNNIEGVNAEIKSEGFTKSSIVIILDEKASNNEILALGALIGQTIALKNIWR